MSKRMRDYAIQARGLEPVRRLATAAAVGPIVLGLATSARAQTPPPPASPAPAASPAPNGAPAPANPAPNNAAAPANPAPPQSGPATGSGGTGPGANPPPYMYQEPVAPGQQLPPPPSATPSAPPPAEPLPRPAPPPYPSRAPGSAPVAPYYVYEPLPPPPLRHRAPMSALWLGIRGGVLFPAGSLYDDEYPDAFGYSVVATQPWSRVAGPGPVGELNLGARLARRYVLYGLWEHAWLASGSDSTVSTYHGNKARTDFVGAGFRWSSNPDTAGVVVDLALGYRWFHESWPDATIDFRGFGEARFGIGADLRVSDSLTLSPMFALSVGSFSDRQLQNPNGSGDFGGLTAAHNTVTLTLGAHYDLVP